MIENNFDKYSFPKDKFQFARSGVKLHDAKLQTKPRGYFKDAWIRFKKNKSSVVAAIIIIFLVLYAIVAPIISPYTMDDKEARYAFCHLLLRGRHGYLPVPRPKRSTRSLSTSTDTMSLR